jgi:hypothetical protein
LLDLLTPFGTALAVVGRTGGELVAAVVEVLEPLLPVASLVTGGVQMPSVLDLTGFAVIGYAIYTFGTEPIARVDEELAESRVFRLLLLGWGFAFLSVLRGSVSTAGLLATFAPIAVVGPLSFALYARLHGWDLFHPDGRAAGIGDQLVSGDIRTELRDGFERPGALGVLARGIWVMAFGLPFVLAALGIGILLRVLAFTFPVPDLLAIGYIFAVWSDTAESELTGRSVRSVVGTAAGAVERRLFPEGRDPESRVVRILGACTDSLKGMFLGIIGAAGLFVAAIPLVFGVRGIPNAASIVVQAVLAAGSVQSVADAWVLFDAAGRIVGMVVLWTASGAYGMWFWVRVFDRVPRYLRWWHDQTERPDAPARPPGSLLPSVVLFTAGFLVAMQGLPAWLHVSLLVGWPVLVSVPVLLVRWTRRRGETPVRNEDYAVTLAVTLGLVDLWVADVITSLPTDTSAWRLVQFRPDPLAVGVVVLVVFFAYGSSGSVPTNRSSSPATAHNSSTARTSATWRGRFGSSPNPARRARRTTSPTATRSRGAPPSRAWATASASTHSRCTSPSGNSPPRGSNRLTSRCTAPTRATSRPRNWPRWVGSRRRSPRRSTRPSRTCARAGRATNTVRTPMRPRRSWIV